jgi:hypothetical protein
MSQIQTPCRADNTCPGFKPGNTRLKPIDFKANKDPDCQTDMIPLRDFEPILTTVNTRKLLQVALVNLNCQASRAEKAASSMVMSRKLVAQYSASPLCRPSETP